MAAGRSVPATRGASVLRYLTWVMWLVMPVGGTAILLTPEGLSGETGQTILMVSLSAFFLLALARLVIAAALSRARRAALLVLALGILLWAAGSAVLNGVEHPGATVFPAPGEWLFLSSYVAMAAYLLLGVSRRSAGTGEAWLEAGVVCGAVGCLAGVLVLTPASWAFPDDGLALLVALLYPLIDIVLAIIVLAQVVLRLRGRGRQAVGLITGFLLLAVADCSFVLNLESGTYDFSLAFIVVWATAFACIVGAATTSHADAPSQTPRKLGPIGVTLAAGVALLVLVLRPAGQVGWYLTVPALVTLLAVGGRMVLALRQARGATEAYRLSRTDELTDLPNRRAMLSDLDVSLAQDGPLSLMLLDLDGFKDVNDTLGHAAGDAVLELVALRMRQALPSEIGVARLGGDEFALIVHEDDPVTLLEIAGEVRDTLRERIRVEGLELVIHASLGIASRQPGDRVATDLLRRADIAMYQAKTTKVGALIYEASRDGFSRQRLRLAEDLRRGIADGQVTVWYQPQVDAVTREVCGVEALVRWMHPQQGLLPPALFLPGARRSGLMLALSEAVIRLAIDDARRWRDLGLTFRTSLNLAPPELLGGTLIPRLFEAIDQAALPPESIVVEVTEDSFLTDPERARSVLQDLRRHHVQVAIDDYGTGFSSLSYLRDLPIQEMKMDRSFIASVRSDPRSNMIVSSTIQMAHALGLRLVAEGVEDAAVANQLAEMGTDTLQGYHIARPMPAAEVEGWVRRWNTRPDVLSTAVMRP